MEVYAKIKLKNKEEKVSLKKKIENYLEEEKTDFIEIKSIKKGDIFYECVSSFGVNYQYQALENAREHDGNWYCVAKNTNDEIFELFVCGQAEKMFLPLLFQKPQISEKKGKKIIYPIY